VELTHLDQHPISDHNLLAEHFMTEESSLALDKRIKESEPGSVQATTPYYFKEGDCHDIVVEVVEYQPAVRMFRLHNAELGIDLVRQRPQFKLLDTWPTGGVLAHMENERERRDAIVERAESKQYLRVAKLI